jgi:hypothetical protein
MIEIDEKAIKRNYENHTRGFLFKKQDGGRKRALNVMGGAPLAKLMKEQMMMMSAGVKGSVKSSSGGPSSTPNGTN